MISELNSKVSEIFSTTTKELKNDATIEIDKITEITASDGYEYEIATDESNQTKNKPLFGRLIENIFNHDDVNLVVIKEEENLNI